MMKLLVSIALLVISTVPVLADPCHDRFSDLLINGNPNIGPTRLHITQEIVGGKTSLNYHHSDGNGNGMTEMINPVNDPWSLFLGDKMYRSDDKGKSWSFLSSFDAAKSKADVKSALTKDAAGASDLACGKEDLDSASHEVVEGNYTSSMVSGASIFQKYWINPGTGYIAKTYSHLKSSGFESKTTQLIELAPNLTLPKPE